MASLSFTHFSSLPRWHSNLSAYPCMNLVQLQVLGLRSKWIVKAVSRKKVSEAIGHEELEGEGDGVEKKTRKTSKTTSGRSRKKEVLELLEKESISASDGTVTDEEAVATSESREDSRKIRRRTRRKAAAMSCSSEEGSVEKKVTRRRRTKKVDIAEDQGSETESSDQEDDSFLASTRRRRAKKVDVTEDQGSKTESSDREDDAFLANADVDYKEGLKIKIEGGEDISFSYGWPPLVCCFGAAQHVFVPSGRRANRLVDCELREKRKEVIWTRENFVWAPGGCASNVAVALASLGGKVAFMGKVGDDDYGKDVLLQYVLSA